MPDDLCRCGHTREDHYQYICNGEPAWRCRSCDPVKNRPSGDYEMASDSYVGAMDRAANHAYQPDDARAKS